MVQKGYTNVVYEKKERVAVITLDRPEALNALNTALPTDLRDAEADESIHVIVLAGAGDKAFRATKPGKGGVKNILGKAKARIQGKIGGVDVAVLGRFIAAKFPIIVVKRF